MAKKKIPKEKITPPVVQNTDTILSHILQSNHEKSTERNAIAENHLQATAQTNTLLENNVEATGRVIKEGEKTNELLSELNEKLDPQELGEGQVFTFKGAKGDKGEKGDTPTDEELVALIKPLIPNVKDGHTPTEQELLALILPQIPIVKDGETPDDKRLLALIRPLIPTPEVIHGKTPTKNELEKIIKPLIPKAEKAPNLPTVKEFIAMLKGKLSYSDLIDLPNLMALHRQSSKTVSLSELDDVDLSALTKNAQNKYQLGSPSGGGGGGFSNQVALTGTATTWNIPGGSPVPTGIVMLFIQGQYQNPTTYSIISRVVTTAQDWTGAEVLAVY